MIGDTRAGQMATAWESYMCAYMPSCAGPAQVEATRHAFYAGAAMVLAVARQIGESPKNPTQMDVNVVTLGGVFSEVHAFFEREEGE